MTTLSSNLHDSNVEVPQRLAHADEIPASAARLVKLAHAHGWAATTWYSRGTRLGAKKVSDNLTVRLAKGTQRLVGVWVDGSFGTGLIGLDGKQLHITLKARELSEAVKGA